MSFFLLLTLQLFCHHLCYLCHSPQNLNSLYFLNSDPLIFMNSEHVEYKKVIPNFYAPIHCDLYRRCVTPVSPSHSFVWKGHSILFFITDRVSMVTRIVINDAFLGAMWINRWPADPEIVKPFPNVLLEWNIPGCINPNAGRGCISKFICIKWNIHCL